MYSELVAATREGSELKFGYRSASIKTAGHDSRNSARWLTTRVSDAHSEVAGRSDSRVHFELVLNNMSYCDTNVYLGCTTHLEGTAGSASCFFREGSKQKPRCAIIKTMHPARAQS